MHAVGNPRPTNPSKRLAASRQRRAGRRCASRAEPDGRRRARPKQVASGAALAAATAGGGVVAVARRDRQEGVNFVTRQWLSAVFAINGVQVRAVGEEHLRSPRPAVFVFNHRNNIDGFIAGSLVGHDFVSVGDREVVDHRLVALLARLSEIAFLDRDDHEEAVAAWRRSPRWPVGPDRAGRHPRRHHLGGRVRDGRVPHRLEARVPSCRS